VHLPESAIRVLAALLERAPDVVDKDTLLDAGWPDAEVIPDNLVQAIHAIRSALGGDARQPVYVRTIHRRGYSFVGPVTRGESPAPAEDAGVIPQPEEARKSGKRLIVIIGLCCVLGLAAWALFSNRQEGHERKIAALAVLPMQELSAAPGQEYFADGMTDALITELARIRQLNVISRTSVMKFRNTRLSVPEIARQLRVDAIVEGTVTRENGRVRVIAQLVDANDHHIWGENYESEDQDILRMQRRLAETVAQAIGERLTVSDTEPLEVNPEAHEAYLRGRYVLRMRNERSFHRAQEFFHRAIELDPAYAPAYSGLADTYNLMANYGFAPSPASREKAREMAMKALEIDGNLAGAHLALALVEGEYDWNFEAAEKEFQKALALRPSDAEIRARHAQLLVARGRLGAANEEILHASRLDPLSEIINSNAAWFLFLNGLGDEAEKKLHEVLALSPGFTVAWYYLGSIYDAQGKFDQAIAAQRKAVSLSSGSSYAKAALAHALARSGRQAEAQDILDALETESRQAYVSPVGLAVAELGLGQLDTAFARLEEAFSERKGWLLEMRVDPIFDAVREDPRYLDLVSRIGLAPVERATPERNNAQR